MAIIFKLGRTRLCNFFYKLFLFSLFILFLETIEGQSYNLQEHKKNNNPDTLYINTLLRTAYNKGFENVDSMLSYTTKALELSKKINYTRGLARSYHLLGRVYSAQSLYDLALENFLKAKNIYVTEKDKYNTCSVIIGIGNVYWYAEKFKEAKEIYLETLERSKQLKDVKLEAGTYQNLGLVYGKLNNADSAIYYLKKAYRLHSMHENYTAQALALYNIGDFYLQRNNYDSALYYLNHTLEKYDYLKPSSKAKLFVSIALAHLKKGNISQAEHYAKKAFPKATESKSIDALSEYYHVTYRIDSVKGDFKNACIALVEYYSLKERMLNEKNQMKLSTYYMIWQFEKKEREILKLKTENDKIKFNANKNKICLAISVIVLVLLLLIVILIFMLFKIKVKKNKELELVNNTLNKQKLELQALNEKISAQSDDLFDKNKELELLMAQLKEAQMKLVHSEKMSSVGLLVTGISHEINTPLYHITGSLKILEHSLQEVNENFKYGRYNNNDELFKVIEELIVYINTGAQEISAIINSLMTFAFKGKNKTVTKDIHEIINNTLTIINHYIPSNIQIEKRYNKTLKINCSSDLMHQVFVNIITNAVDAIKTKELLSDEKIIIETGLSDNKKYMVIKIFNTGPHIPSKDINKIFDPFYTTKIPGKGAGLGLTICSNIIEKEHNGFIEVHNLAHGVSFQINIPC